MSGATVTIITKARDASGSALLSKRIALGPDGRPISDGSPCIMTRGSAISVPAPDAAALAEIIAGLGSDQALALGQLKTGVGVQRDVVTDAVWRGLPPAQQAVTIARTRAHIDYVRGQPAWLLVDFDRKGMSGAVQNNIAEHDGMWGALVSVVPGLASAPRVSRESTSSGLSHATTGEQFPGSGGEHHYILTADGGDIARALRALHERCWLHGLGWMLLGASGHLLSRSIVDATVGGGERLCFEGPPEIVSPLVQDQAVRAPRIFP